MMSSLILSCSIIIDTCTYIYMIVSGVMLEVCDCARLIWYKHK